MDQLIFASLSHTHYWYEEGMLKVLNLHRDKKIVRRKPGRDENILRDHKQDGYKGDEKRK